MSTIIVTTYDAVPAVVRFLLTCPVIYFDIETTGLDPYTTQLLILSLHATNGSETHTFVFDIVQLGVEILYELRPVLECPDSIKVAHNAVFDWKHLYHHGNIYTAPVYCTMIAEQVIKSGLLVTGFGLDDVAERRMGIVMDKTIRNGFINRDTAIPFTEAELAYAAEDTIVLAQIYEQQWREIKAEGLTRIIEEVECPLIPITAQLEYNGIEIDEQRLRETHPVVEKIIDAATFALQDEIIKSGEASELTFNRDGYNAINLGSSKQLLAIFNAIGIKVTSTGKKELSDWDAQWARKNQIVAVVDDEDDFDVGYAHPLLKQHAIRTAASKLQSTYVEGILARINPVTKRIHPGFKQCGAAATGRMSSVAPNAQNLPQRNKLSALGLEAYDIRSMLIPAQGCEFIIADFSSIELAILAAMSNDERLTYEILQGDVHAYVTNNLIPEQLHSVIGDLITPKNKKSNPVAKIVRDLFKKVSFGIVYGSTGYNLYRTLYFDLLTVGIHITQNDADMWVERWKKDLFPQTGVLLQQNSDYAVTRYYTETAMGRRRHWDQSIRFNKWRMLAAMREGSNAPIQGCCADMIKLSMIALDARFDKSLARIVAPVHDEIISESRKGYTQEAATIVQQCMEESARSVYPQHDPNLFKVEYAIADCYNK